MRSLLLSFTLLVAAGDRTSDRDALLAADRSLSDRTAGLGMLQGFLPTLTEGAAYLYPGAPLLRGTDRIRSFLETAVSTVKQAWTPAFADVSADGRLGYTYGWTHSGGTRGKYLACLAENGRRVASRGVREHQTRARGRLGDAAASSFGGGVQISQGREAIGAGFDSFPAGAVLEWWPVAAEIAPSGDLGCTIGEAKIASLNHYSKYLTIWRRQQDGSWKFVADGGNVRPAS